jgi:copper(I)-binding protein
MTSPRRRLFLSGLGAAATTMFVPPARACEYFTSTLRVIHPWTRATAGVDEAVLCMGFDSVRQDDRLIAVRTPVATDVRLSSAEAGAPLDLAIPAGQALELDESGLHLRLLGLRQPLQVGRTYPLELDFAHGGSVIGLLNVDFTAMPTFRFR